MSQRPATTPLDKHVRVNGLRLHYLDYGAANAQPMLLLHGYGSECHTFDTFASHLAGEYHILSLDFRGFGDSQWSRDGYSHQLMAADVEGFIKALGLKRVVLMGQSLGGLVAMSYLLQPRPEVEALVIVDIGPDVDPVGYNNFRAYLAALPDRFASFEEAVAAGAAGRPDRPEALIRRQLQHNLRQSDGGWTWKFDPRLRGPHATEDWPKLPDLWPALRGLACPCLVVRGQRSEYLSASVAEVMQRVTPRCRLVTLPTGHSVHTEAPEALAQAVREFLKDAP
ncbi:MAG: alpha/beta hydrolase [Chloroflexota bacterium]|nr:alpha/beta hydrolase [Chloroflexota bacterium]